MKDVATNIILINIRSSDYVRAMTLLKIELADITDVWLKHNFLFGQTYVHHLIKSLLMQTC